MAQQSYSFPILDRKEILTCLQELGIAATEEDLTKPEEGRVRALYSRFVEDMMAFVIRESAQPQFSALDEIQNPELHDESLPEVYFMRSL